MNIRQGNDSRQSHLVIGPAGRLAPVLSAQKGLGGQLGEPVYCGSCGCLGGYVTANMELTAQQRADGENPGVFYLCGTDNGCGHNCEGRYGPMAEQMRSNPSLAAHKVPDPVGFRGV